MASGEHGSGRFGGESSGKSDVWKYFDKSADRKKAECKLCSNRTESNEFKLDHVGTAGRCSAISPTYS